MDMWSTPDKKVIEAAEKYYGQAVIQLLHKTTGLWRSVKLADGAWENIYEWMVN